MIVNIAIKPGSTFTSIYVAGHGLVLKEPTLVALIGKDKKQIRAFGYDALAMRGKAPNVTVISPISDGIIKEPEIFTRLLKEFLIKICPETAIFAPRYKAIVSIPLGLADEEREMYEEAFLDAGILSVTLVPGIVLSAIGADLPVGTGRGMLAVNLGGGKTEIALLSYGGIVNGCGVGIGGNVFDNALIDFLLYKYNIKISLDTATKIREEIGSLYDNDIATMTVSGIDKSSNLPTQATVCASDVSEVLKPYFVRICDLILTIVKACPPSIARDVYNGGLIITGGVSNIPGIDDFFRERLSLPVKVFVKPEYVQIVGAGKLIGNNELMDKLISGGSV